MTDLAVADAVEVDLDDPRRGPLRVLFSAAWKQHRTKIGLGITLLLVGIAVFGRLVAPYEPDQGVEGLLPFAPPSSDAWLGTDNLGRDVLSRFLYGGLSVLWLSGLATALGMTLGVTSASSPPTRAGSSTTCSCGPWTSSSRFPQIVFALVLAATVGPKLWLLVLAVGFTTRRGQHASHAVPPPRWSSGTSCEAAEAIGDPAAPDRALRAASERHEPAASSRRGCA